MLQPIRSYIIPDIIPDICQSDIIPDIVSDMRLAGHQHLAFHEYNDPRGNKLFARHFNGSVTFQLAQLKIGPDKVPVLIVLYIDGTLSNLISYLI